MKIGILCGGGDVPGLNQCVKAIVLNAISNGISVFAIRRGWMGLINTDLTDSQSIEQNIFSLTEDQVARIDRFGPTIINSSRANPFKVKVASVPSFIDAAHVKNTEQQDFKDISEHVLRVVEGLGLEAVIVIGGDDTLEAALNMQKKGLKLIAIPKTMDNDIFGTDYSIGFSTAVSRSIECINSIRSVAGSHERIAVVELFGRTSGETSLISGYLAYADRTFIPEVPYQAEKAAELLLEDRASHSNNYAVAVISEGARIEGHDIVQSTYEDAFGNRRLGGAGQQLATYLREKTGVETIYQSLGYLMRSGEPDALDRMVARGFAKLSIDLLANSEFGRMVAIRDGKYTHCPLELIGRGSRRVDIEELYDSLAYRPQVPRLVGKPMFLY